MTTEHVEAAVEAADEARLAEAARTASDVAIRRALLVAGATMLSATVAFFLVRRAVRRPRAADPTAERIQSLIDEANDLLRQLDDQRPS